LRSNEADLAKTCGVAEAREALDAFKTQRISRGTAMNRHLITACDQIA
jgi:hypothetical protein